MVERNTHGAENAGSKGHAGSTPAVGTTDTTLVWWNRQTRGAQASAPIQGIARSNRAASTLENKSMSEHKKVTMTTRTLLLTPWYIPIQVLHWQDAIKMVYEKTVDVVVEYDEDVRSPSVTWKMPAVVRLRKLKRDRTQGSVKFSRVNVYARDGYRCQYCGERFHETELSYDHVHAVLGAGPGKEIQLPGHLTAYSDGELLLFRPTQK